MPIRRPLVVLASTLGLIASGLFLHTAPAGASALQQGALVPDIIGGQEASISQFPWLVYLVLLEPAEGLELSCGGSILDATHILTAAHCVDHDGTTITYPAADLRVLAGASNVSSFTSSLTPPAGSQERHVARIRADPEYVPLPETKDDVAVLELSSPLELSLANNAQAIPLVAEGATPAPGTALSLSGYGKENGEEHAEPSGQLFSTTLTAISSDACRQAVGFNSAVLLCATGVSSSACQGDSGGPLTEGTPAVQVGIVDFGERGCPVDSVNGFSNVAAPEVRAFIEGSETPPVAARPSAVPSIRSVGATPVDYSPLTCEPGAWSGSPAFTYTFAPEGASAVVLQSGPSNTYTPGAAQVGERLVCIVEGSNAGGVTTVRSAPTAAVAADRTPPSSSITSLSCHLQKCAISIVAADPNAVALDVESWVSYQRSAPCPARKRSRHGHSQPARRSVCVWTDSVILALKSTAAGVFHASMSGLPYHKSLTFTAVATNAAGLHPPHAAVRSTMLHPPRLRHARVPLRRRAARRHQRRSS